jgi:hypothetical protein
MDKKVFKVSSGRAMTRRKSPKGVMRPKDNDDERMMKFDDKHHVNGFQLPSHLLNRFSIQHLNASE